MGAAHGDLTGNAFRSDDGSVPPEVAAVLAARQHGHADVRAVVTCLVGHRVLVPLLEVDGDRLDRGGWDPCAGSDRAVAAVSVVGPGGVPAGLAFTGSGPLERWDAAARPMPVAAVRAAAAVLADGGRTLVLDPGSPHSLQIQGAALARLASGEPWPEPWADPVVQAAVASELGPVLASGEIRVRLSMPPVSSGAGLMVDVQFAEAPSTPVMEQRATVLAQRLSGSARLREVFDGVLAVQLLRAG